MDKVRRIEEQRVVGKADVPDDVKSELDESVERHQESDDMGRGDEPR